MPPRFDPKRTIWTTWSLQVKRTWAVLKLTDALVGAKRDTVAADVKEMVVSVPHEIAPNTDSELFVSLQSVHVDKMWSILEVKYKQKDKYLLYELHRQFHGRRPSLSHKAE